MDTLHDSFIMEHNYFERIPTSMEDNSDSEGPVVLPISKPDSMANNVIHSVEKDTVVKFLPGMKSAVKNTESHTTLNKNVRINTSVNGDVKGQEITTVHPQALPSKPSQTTSANPEAHFPQKIPVKLVLKNQGKATPKISIPSKLLLMPTKNNAAQSRTAIGENAASDKLVGFIFS